MSSITVRHDLRCRFGFVRDQGARQTCLVFATSDAHAAAIGHPWVELSCEYLFYHAKQRESTPPYQGTTIPAIRAALEHDGQPAEADWPYLPATPADLTKWKPPAKIKTLFRRRSAPNGKAFRQIWEAIEADTPTVVGMTLSAAFNVPTIDGVIDANEAVDPAIKHAVLAIGTGTLGKNGKFVLVRNSWGDTWGLSGYAWVSERYLAPRILAAITLQ